MNKVTAIIAARSGSVRVKNKNLRPFYQSSLLELKIKQLLTLPSVEKVIVNSNDEEILKIAEITGADIVKRDEIYATNESNMSDVFKNIAENCPSENILYANCTNPLVENSSYEKAINIFFNKKEEFDSVVSCHDIKEFMYRDFKPLNYDPKNQIRSQDLPDIVALNFAISVISREQMIQSRNIIGSSPFFYKLDEFESVDIDTEFDFFVAESLYKKKQGDI